MRDGEDGADDEEGRDGKPLIPLLRGLCANEEGAFAYLLFLCFFLLGEDGTEVEGEDGSKPKLSLDRFACAKAVSSDMMPVYAQGGWCQERVQGCRSKPSRAPSFSGFLHPSDQKKSGTAGSGRFPKYRFFLKLSRPRGVTFMKRPNPACLAVIIVHVVCSHFPLVHY